MALCFGPGWPRRLVSFPGEVHSHPQGRSSLPLLQEGSPATCHPLCLGDRKNSTQQSCLLCRRADTAPELCGLMLEAEGICAHQYCLFFANELFHRRPRNDGLMGFLPEDILHIVERAEQKDCFVCSESGATITCQERGCNRSFHFPCALEGGCVTQFLPHYRSYCWEHRPQQEPQAAPENTACLICLEPVEERTSYGTMVCPACQHAWFHRGCIQGQAMGAGIYCFQCPLCRDKDQFVPVMLILGIRVPLRMPLWENDNAYAHLGDRHSRCDARECLCPQGREHREGRG
ncbi:PHD finger protein 7 [Columba livia]|uniref:PHD finger protein 7 n=1 Tax=Columba livia TaxID=8932 RepID=A0A2I0LW50_COLLI|nr:PHD finger protein 7 [Columba livia]